MSKQVICDKCRGSGAKHLHDMIKCNVCGGKGIKTTTQQIAPGFIQRMQITCDTCKGKGTVVKSKCPECDGKKVKRGTNQLTMTIEKGFPDKHEVIFEREGDQHPDMTAGDVVLVVTTASHPIFNRSGHDLYMKQSINLKEALLGFSKKIQHLDGAMLEVIRKEITQPGRTMIFFKKIFINYLSSLSNFCGWLLTGFVQKIEKAGMPVHRYPFEKGDLYIKYDIELPRELSLEQQEGKSRKR
jgi:DnaJ-related protein SCJ1